MALPSQAMADWQPAGAAVTQSNARLHGYDLKRIGGVPYVAWSEFNGHNDVTQVARLTPGSGKWLRVGPPVNLDPQKDAVQPSLAAGPGGVPWIAWTETDRKNINEIRAAHLSADGSRWIEPDSRDFSINRLPPPSNPVQPSPSTFYADSPQLTFFGDLPYITFLQDNSVEYEVNVVRLAGRGNAWESVGGLSCAIPRDPRAMVFDGALYAGVTDRFSSVMLARRANRRWNGVGPFVNSSVPDTPMGGLDGIAGFRGEPYVLWSTHSGEKHAGVYVSRFSGGAWAQAGGGPVGQGAGSSIRVIGGRLYAAWNNGGTEHVSRLADDGLSWQSTPGAVNDQPATGGSVLTGIDGTPYVAFAESDAGVTSLRVVLLDGAPAAAGPDDGDGSDLSATAPAGDDISPDGDTGSPPPPTDHKPAPSSHNPTPRHEGAAGTVHRRHRHRRHRHRSHRT